MKKKSFNVSRYKRTVTYTKTKKPISRKATKKQIYKKNIIQLRNDAKRVNNRIRRLMKKGFNVRSYAGKQLYSALSNEKLDLIRGQLIDIRRIKNNFNMTTITAIKKALNTFIDSEYSLVRGIKKINNMRRIEIAQRTDDKYFASELSDEDINNIYKMFDEENYKKLSRSYSSATIFDLMLESKKENWSKDKLLNEFRTYSENGIDKETKLAIEDILVRFMK